MSAVTQHSWKQKPGKLLFVVMALLLSGGCQSSFYYNCHDGGEIDSKKKSDVAAGSAYSSCKRPSQETWTPLTASSQRQRRQTLPEINSLALCRSSSQQVHLTIFRSNASSR